MLKALERQQLNNYVRTNAKLPQGLQINEQKASSLRALWIGKCFDQMDIEQIKWGVNLDDAVHIKGVAAEKHLSVKMIEKFFKKFNEG